VSDLMIPEWVEPMMRALRPELRKKLSLRDINDIRKWVEAQITAERARADGLEGAKDGAYLERNKCVALIARMAMALGYRAGTAKTAIEEWSEDWHGCVYIDLPAGQVSWHCHDSQSYLFDWLPPYCAEWDGHDTPEKYRRVLQRNPMPNARAERAEQELVSIPDELADRFHCLAHAHKHRCHEALCSAVFQLERAEQEAAGLRADAERYRLLRQKVCIAGGGFHIVNLHPTYVAPIPAIELDAILDAAIDAARAGGGE